MSYFNMAYPNEQVSTLPADILALKPDMSLEEFTAEVEARKKHNRTLVWQAKCELEAQGMAKIFEWYKGLTAEEKAQFVERVRSNGYTKFKFHDREQKWKTFEDVVSKDLDFEAMHKQMSRRTEEYYSTDPIFSVFLRFAKQTINALTGKEYFHFEVSTVAPPPADAPEVVHKLWAFFDECGRPTEFRGGFSYFRGQCETREEQDIVRECARNNVGRRRDPTRPFYQ